MFKDVFSKKNIIIIGLIVVIILTVVMLFALKTTRNEQGELPAEPVKTNVNIIEAVTQKIKYSQYNNGDFSMKIPEGWMVETVQGNNYGIRVYNPENENYQMFYFNSLGGFLKNQEAKQYYQVYSNISSSGFEKLPVLNPGNVENIYKNWITAIGYAKANLNGYASFNFPILYNYKATEYFEISSKLKETLEDKATGNIIRAEYQDTVQDKKYEGIFAGIVVDMDSADTKLPYAVYNLCGITSEKGELIDWEPVLMECVKSIRFSEKFLNKVKASNKNNFMANINDELQILSKGFEESWNSRQVQVDIDFQKQKDSKQNVERVYNLNDNKVYLVQKGWFEKYVGDEYLLITDEMYLKPISGKIE